MDVKQSSSKTPDDAPTPGEVADLYAAASQGPPLSEPRAQADAYADLFRYVLTRDDAAWVARRVNGTLVGLAYGHHWRWGLRRIGSRPSCGSASDPPRRGWRTPSPCTCSPCTLRCNARAWGAGCSTGC